jgi:hypothetical protein
MIYCIAKGVPFYKRQYEEKDKSEIEANKGLIRLRVICNDHVFVRYVQANEETIQSYVNECVMFEQLRNKYENPLWKNMYLKGEF